MTKSKSKAETLLQEGHDLTHRKLFDRGVKKFYQACQEDPGLTRAKSAYLYSRQKICSFDETCREEFHALKELILDGKSAPPFSVFILSDEPDMVTLSAVNTARDLQEGIKPYKDWNINTDGGRLRIGYISSYFRKHALSVLIAEVLKKHDREKLEIYIFAYGDAKETEERQKIMEYADQFFDVRGLNDDKLAELIHEQGIHILFDMNGYSGKIRPTVLARKPAPINALWMSYPATTGGYWSDYYISDRYIVETSEHEATFAEKVKRLSRCCWTYDTESRVIDPEFTRERAGLSTEAIVLGNFNGSHKLSFHVLSMWFTIMQNCPNTVLWTMESNHLHVQNMRRMALEKYGVNPSRIIASPIMNHAKHLGRFLSVDLVLDTFPCNGHTLSMDSLWAGCPVITYAGRTSVSRVASSALRTQGFDELVTYSTHDYIKLAIDLINDKPRREDIRHRMIQARFNGILFDQDSFVKELDSTYLDIWNEASQTL